MNGTIIPLVDLSAQHMAHKAEFEAAVTRCLDASSFIGGPDYNAFADEFATFCGCGHVALCGSGTDALYLSIVECMGKGDGTGEIITTSLTFAATSEAILRAGYRPVFADIDPDTYLITADTIEKMRTSQTRGIVPVHLYGQMAPMDEIMNLAATYGLIVIEDAAQAHGAAWKGKGPGQWGHAACFSFFPGKNLGAWGDAGAVFTKDQTLAERIKVRSDHGRKEKYLHEQSGISSRMDGIQAAVLRVKLRYLSRWNHQRQNIAQRYNLLLGENPNLNLPICMSDAIHVYHLYVIQMDCRDTILERLQQAGIKAGVHYPVPLHEQPVYSHLGYTPKDLPVAHEVTRRIVSLPIYPYMLQEAVVRVAQALNRIISDLNQ